MSSHQELAHHTPAGKPAERENEPQPADPVEPARDTETLDRGDDIGGEDGVSAAPIHAVPVPGDSAGDMWPGVRAVRAVTDEQGEVVEIEGTALAPPGKPDGEVDTRP